MTNEAELLFAGLTVTIPSSKRVESGDEVNVRFQMQAASDAPLDQFHANVTIKSEGSSLDPNVDIPVTNSAEWNVLIEASLQSTIWDNLPFIIVGVIVLILVIVLLVILRKRKRAREEAEAEEEAAKASKKKRKKRPKVEADEEDAEE
jgi:hypothetical protein